MTTPEHPVTLGDLKTRCVHRDFDNCNEWLPGSVTHCEGGRWSTVADLVSALRAVLEHIAVLLWQLDSGPWARLMTFSDMDEETKGYWLEQAGAFLDALAEAQPFPPAGR